MLIEAAVRRMPAVTAVCPASVHRCRASRHCEGTIVKPYALAALGLLLFSGAVQAAVIDLGDLGNLGDRTVPRSAPVVAPPVSMSELPEPEVFAMMLVGLVLIGYRARRDSSEKFE